MVNSLASTYFANYNSSNAENFDNVLNFSSEGTISIGKTGDTKFSSSKKVSTTGFTIGGNNLYLTNSDGNLIVISLSAGNVLKMEKVARDLISKPLIYNENLFIVKNGSITQYD